MSLRRRPIPINKSVVVTSASDNVVTIYSKDKQKIATLKPGESVQFSNPPYGEIQITGEEGDYTVKTEDI